MCYYYGMQILSVLATRWTWEGNSPDITAVCLQCLVKLISVIPPLFSNSCNVLDRQLQCRHCNYRPNDDHLQWSIASFFSVWHLIISLHELRVTFATFLLVWHFHNITFCCNTLLWILLLSSSEVDENEIWTVFCIYISVVFAVQVSSTQRSSTTMYTLPLSFFDRTYSHRHYWLATPST